MLVHDVMMQERDYYYGTQNIIEWNGTTFLCYNKTVKILFTTYTQEQNIFLSLYGTKYVNHFEI